MASVVCTRYTEFFRIDKQDFVDVLKASAEEDIKSKLDFFRGVPFMADVPSGNLAKLAEICSKRAWTTNSTIIREVESLQSVFLVRTGSVRVLRIVPFKKVQRSANRYSLEPCTMPSLNLSKSLAKGSNSTLSSSEEVHSNHSSEAIHLALLNANVEKADTSNLTFKLLCTGVLGPGQYFGHECVIAAIAARRRGISSTSSTLYSEVKSPYSIVTCEPTELFRIAKVDFLKLMTPRALVRMEQQHRALDPHADATLSRLQETYIAQRQWQQGKERILNQIEKERLHRREVRDRVIGRAAPRPKIQ
jgi:CRP-like cAMP-binding protein